MAQTSTTLIGSTVYDGSTTSLSSDSVKGDGYYSQSDGLHTVAYHVQSTFVGSIKMQGSLATTPTDSDWFDIAGTSFTADGSTLVSSYNFTGNFVWVRATVTGFTAGTINKILYNN
jgi:hypothetical protein